MKITNGKLLAPMRLPGRCELCGRACGQREVHHVFCKGMGGGSCLDVPINLVSLGAFGNCCCHSQFHGGHIARAEFLAVIASREGMDIDLIDETLKRLHNAVKDKLCECPEAKRVQVGRAAWACFGCGKDRPAPELRKHLHEMLG